MERGAGDTSQGAVTVAHGDGGTAGEGKGGRKRKGHIQELHVRSWGRRLLMGWVKVLRERKASRVTGFLAGASG